MQSGGRLVENVERVAAFGALQLRRQLDALRLATGELGRWLAKAKIADADLAEHVERPAYVRLVAEELPGCVDSHVEHFRDVLARGK